MVKQYQNKEWLEKKYLKEKLSMQKIGELIGADTKTISNWLKRYNIPCRYRPVVPDKEWLKEKYIGEKLSTREIAELFEVNKTTISRWLKKFDIPRRTFTEAMTGHKQSEETKRKRSISNSGQIPWIKGRHHSKKTKEKIRNMQKGRCGIYSRRWKGGITPLNKLIWHLFKYRQWRSDVFTRDNFICQECGEESRKLNAHHVKPFSKILQYYEIITIEEALECEELWDINNGITLCEECHREIHKKRGRKLCLKN